MRINRVLTATVGLALAAAGGISAAAIAAPPAAAPQRAAGSGAARVDRSLGNGLGRLLAEKGVGAATTNRVAAAPGLFNQSKLAVTDPSGRVLVQLTPQRGVNRAAFRAAAKRAGLAVVAEEPKLGTLEGFVAPASAKALASVPGAGTLAMSTKARTSIGATTSQGRGFQKATAVQTAGVDGTGITVGALSDSYNTATTFLDGKTLTVKAANDVASGDLPGTGNAAHPTPVAVLDELPAAGGGADEGRAMLQIVHDLAPGSKLCFATAFKSEVSFANNIRALADPLGACKADVIVDDVSYFDEPFFSEGIIGDAVDDVAANGVSYFSSAGNNGDQNAWRAPVRLVTGTAATSARTAAKLNFAGVDPQLYSGGFEDFNPSSTAVDIAQNLTVDNGGGIFDLQWSDPTDLAGPTVGTPLDTQNPTLVAGVPLNLSYTPAAGDVGKLVQFKADSAVSGALDLVLTVTKPNGTKIGPIDTGTSPETAATTLVAGTYTITIEGFRGTEAGAVVSTVSPVTTPSKTTTDFNALFFDSAGNFVSALGDVNQVSGRPIEITGLNGPDAPGGKSKLQLVIAKSGTAATNVKEIGYINNGGIYTTEYATALAPAVFGHATADGATAVAAFDPFRSYLPEFFTSPGGKQKIYFDSAGDPFDALGTPKVRQVPQIASADGVNTTFFGFDSRLDTDTNFRNFFGTSAAAPHAAAIAALMLDNAGGPKSLTPAAVQAKMQRSTFVHDLDPNVSVGKVGTFTITARGAQNSEGDSAPGSMANSRFFDVQYTGATPIRKITFYGETASPTARTDAGVGGIVFDPRPLGTAPRFDNGFPFTIGSVSGGLTKASVSASFSVPVAATATQKSFRHMTITFSGNGLNAGERLQFGVDRDIYSPAPNFFPDEGNGADELGGAFDYASNVVKANGMKFVATRTDGTTFTGFFKNSLGKTWSPLDGFGVVNAQTAVLAP